jgi:hypothetical protein
VGTVGSEVVRFSVALRGTAEGLVDLSLRGLPEEIEAFFEPDYLGGDVRVSRLTVRTGALAPGRYPFEVVAGLLRSGAFLEVRLAAPRLTRLFPTQGPPGTEFVLQGENFQPGARLTLAGRAIPVISQAAGLVRGRIPPEAASGRITLVNPDGQNATTRTVFVVATGEQSPSAPPK